MFKLVIILKCELWVQHLSSHCMTHHKQQLFACKLAFAELDSLNRSGLTSQLNM
jgi:hypothetical protein